MPNNPTIQQSLRDKIESGKYINRKIYIQDPVDWKNDETQLNANNMNRMSRGISGLKNEFTTECYNMQGILKDFVVNSAGWKSKNSGTAEIFNDYELNRALAEYSHAEGRRAIAGCKGYYIDGIDVENNYMYLRIPDAVDDDDARAPEWDNPGQFYNETFESGYEILNDSDSTKEDYVQYGNEFSVSSNGYYHWPFVGKIEEISGNRIKYTSDTLDSSSKWKENVGGNAKPFIFFVPACPEVGKVSVGISAHSEGLDTKASANYSHAEGYGTIVAGQYGHAEGNSTKAGYAGHAEGTGTKAIGLDAHAEGGNTEAIGNDSHAEGYNTKANGLRSHAEGAGTRADGEASHAEGYQAVATGKYAHAEGYSSSGYSYKASGDASHREGIDTISGGECSHAEGDTTVASGRASHAEGKSTKATEKYSHTEGESSEATGPWSHAEGYSSKATADCSHAEGYTTIASGKYSHAEGRYTESEGLYSHAEGQSSKAIGEASHAEGYNTKAKALRSHAEGYSTVVHETGKYSHAEGLETEVSGECAHAEGRKTSASGAVSHAEGDNTIASGNSSHAEGAGTYASGPYSHSEGQSTTASGENSHAEGNETAASGSSSHAEGSNTKASGYSAHAEGEGTTASGKYSHAEGNNTEASGNYSHVEGQSSKAIGGNSHAEGYGTIAQKNSQHVQGRFNIVDDTDNTVYGKYAHIVGNGSSSKRSNAHTLDWSGNAWYAGGLEVGDNTTDSKNTFGLKVGGKTFLNNTLKVAQQTSLMSSLHVDGNVYLCKNSDSKLEVQGESTFNKNATLEENLTVEGAISCYNDVVADSDGDAISLISLYTNVDANSLVVDDDNKTAVKDKTVQGAINHAVTRLVGKETLSVEDMGNISLPTLSSDTIYGVAQYSINLVRNLLTAYILDTDNDDTESRAAIDKLIEISDWIKDDSAGAGKIISDISALQSNKLNASTFSTFYDHEFTPMEMNVRENAQNWNTAYDNSHTHDNFDELDSIETGNVQQWNRCAEVLFSDDDDIDITDPDHPNLLAVVESLKNRITALEKLISHGTDSPEDGADENSTYYIQYEE